MPARIAEETARTAGARRITLNQYCRRERLTDRDLARLFDIHPSHANRLRRRVARASATLALKISQFTRGEVPIEQLLFKAN